MPNINKSRKPKPTDATFRIEDVEPEQRIKYEIAKELGLYDKVTSEGWKSLSAKETGKIGGMVHQYKTKVKALEQKESD